MPSGLRFEEKTLLKTSIVCFLKEILVLEVAATSVFLSIKGTCFAPCSKNFCIKIFKRITLPLANTVASGKLQLYKVEHDVAFAPLKAATSKVDCCFLIPPTFPLVLRRASS